MGVGSWIEIHLHSSHPLCASQKTRSPWQAVHLLSRASRYVLWGCHVSASSSSLLTLPHSTYGSTQSQISEHKFDVTNKHTITAAPESPFVPSPRSVIEVAFAVDKEGSTADVSTGDIRSGDPKGVLLAPDAQLWMVWWRDQPDWVLRD